MSAATGCVAERRSGDEIDGDVFLFDMKRVKLLRSVRSAILSVLECVILVMCVHAQELRIVRTETLQYPLVRTHFIAFDSLGQRQRVLESTTSIRQRDQGRPIVSFSCPESPSHLSAVLSIDVSESMSRGGTPSNLELAKAGAQAFVDALDLSVSECAVTSFDRRAYIVQDFSQRRQDIGRAIESLAPQDGTDYNEALLQRPVGAIQVAASGKNKRTIILLTDGLSTLDVDSALARARSDNVSIHVVCVRMEAPLALRTLAESTGGYWFDSLEDIESIRRVYRMILAMEQAGGACTVVWNASATCSPVLEYSLWVTNGLVRDSTSLSWTPGRQPSLEVQPPFHDFGNLAPLATDTITVRLTARGGPVRLDSLQTPTQPYRILGPTFPVTINTDSSVLVRVVCAPVDSLERETEVRLYHDACNRSAFGLICGSPAQVERLPVLLFPNGGERLVPGIDTTVSWGGVAGSELVTLEYSTDAGGRWQTISDSASGGEFRWRVPATPSKSCLVRISKREQRAQRALRHDQLNSARFSVDGKRFALVGSDDALVRGAIWIYRTVDGVLERQIVVTDDIFDFSQQDAAFSHDGRLVATIGESGRLRIWSLADGSLVMRAASTLPSTTGRFTLAFLPGDSRLLINGVVVSAQDGSIVDNLAGEYPSVISRDGTRASALNGAQTGNFNLYEVPGFQNFGGFGSHREQPIFINASIDLSSNGRLALTSYGDSTLTLVNLEARSTVYTLRFDNNVFDAVFLPGALTFIVAEQNGRVTARSTRDGAVLATFRYPEIQSATALDVSPEGDVLILQGSSLVQGLQSNVRLVRRLFRSRNLTQFRSWQKSVSIRTARPLTNVIVAHNGQTALARDNEGKIRAYNLSGGQMVREIESAYEDAMALAKDGSSFAIIDPTLGVVVRSMGFPFTRTSAVTGIVGARHIDFERQRTSVVYGPALSRVAAWLTVEGPLTGQQSIIDNVPDGNTLRVVRTANQANAMLLVAGPDDKSAYILSDTIGADILSKGRIRIDTLRSASGDAQIFPDGIAHGDISGFGRVAALAPNFTGESGLILSTTGRSIRLAEHYNRFRFSQDGAYLFAAGSARKIWQEPGTQLARGVVIDALYNPERFPEFPDAIESIGQLRCDSCQVVNELVTTPDSRLVVAVGQFENGEGFLRVYSGSSLFFDVSDSLFEIVQPEFRVERCDFGRQLLGQRKDSVFIGRICNSGMVSMVIDSLRLSGPDSSVFEYISGLNREIAPGACADVELGFKPDNQRAFSALLRTFTSAGEIGIPVDGVGQGYALQPASQIDFGQRVLGTVNDSVVRMAVQNQNTFDVQITSVQVEGPDFQQFLAQPLSLVVPAGGTIDITARYVVGILGKAATRIGVRYALPAQGSTFTHIPVYGEGVCDQSPSARGSIFFGVDTLVSQTGETLNVPLRVAPISAFAGGDVVVFARLNGSVLYPATPFETVPSGTSDLHVRFSIESVRRGDTLGFLPIGTALGNAESSLLVVDSIQYVGCQLTLLRDSITIVMSDICRAGGTPRLIDASLGALQLRAFPQPAHQDMTVEISALERGDHVLQLNDIYGRRLMEYRLPLHRAGLYEVRLPVSSLPSGAYLLILTSPGQVRSTPVLID